MSGRAGCTAVLTAAKGWWARALRRMGSEASREGARAIGVGVLGTVTWGVITGVTMVKAGLTVPQALGMTVFVFSGTAQLATLTMVVAGAPLALVLVTALLVSLRFFVYAAAVSQDFGGLPVWQRVLVGYITTDSGLAIYQQRRDAIGDFDTRYSFFLGANLFVWAGWQLGSIVGVLAAGLLPAAKNLAFLGTLAILALLAPMLHTRVSRACAAAAGTCALLLQALPFKLGLFVAVLVGSAVAVAVAPGARR